MFRMRRLQFSLTSLYHINAAICFSSQHPVKTYGYAFFFSLTGYFGISFVLALIKLFGALVAVTGQCNSRILFCPHTAIKMNNVLF